MQVVDALRLRAALRSVSMAITAFAEATADYQRLGETIVHAVAEVMLDTCILALRDDNGITLTPIAIHDAEPRVVAAFAPMLGHSIDVSKLHDSPATAEEMLFQPVVDLALLKKSTSANAFAFFTAIGIRGLISMPLRVRGEVLGMITIARHRPELPALDELDREIFVDLANHAALALANARLIQQLAETERLRKADEHAVRATRFLDAIIENIPDMVFVKEAEHLTFVRFNQAGERLLGVGRSDLIGKSDFDFFPRAEAEFFIAKDRETLAAKQLVDIPEEPIQTSHGQRWLHTKKVPILDDAGRPRYLLGISQDITERKRADAELRAATDAALQAHRELEAFSYSVAHDLRAPLRGIDGFSQALVEDCAATLDDSGRRYVTRIRDGVRRMSELIDSLLQLSRMSRAELRDERVDLGVLARRTLAGLQAADPDRAVETVIAPGLLVTGDPRLLGAVLDNLLGNAWKFTARTAHARIELGVTPGVPSGPGARTPDLQPAALHPSRGPERVFFVRDNGVGFDMAYAHKLFGVFQRLHSESEFAGTGIGLATVARIIQRHHGRVWAEGALGAGATVFFTIGSADKGPS